ncbi:autophagy-related protein 13a-like isoform X2 [Tripterygium wilfordii]|uniref:autophagy-related protein 13a-like isoform X2 n=1 Tax=Tripterygium wilfordii TaxID=458696 RepID=UPI0018F81C3B|nr:autophagy-related protein 13a-like isoform X2 [Tripterygium wilfordii]
MEFHGNSQTETGKLELIRHHFLLKSLHIILDSRIRSLRPSYRSGDLSSASRVRNSDKWFSLVLGDRPAALDNLNFWHRNLTGPMVIDIILVHEPPSSSLEGSHSPGLAMGATVETVIERWVVQYESPQGVAHPLTSDNKKTYKKCIILLRSLYSQMRLLPAYRIFRQLSSSSQSYNFDIIYKVSSCSEPFSQVQEESMKEYTFVPVEAPPGRLCVSVSYYPTLADFNLETSTSFPPRIITDYVGSPTTDRLRTFSSSEKDAGATFPFRMRAPFCAPHQRPHSWTSGFHKGAPFTRNQALGVSPPAYCSSPIRHDFPSLPADVYGQRTQNYRPPTHHKSTSYDEYQLSPPFAPSASPSPPANYSNHTQTHYRSETAPVSIPLPVTGKSLKYLSPNFSDPGRHALPPLSPMNARHDLSSEGSPSSIQSYRKAEAVRAGDLGMTNQNSSHKVSRDSKDDSGRFSGLLSSSGSPCIGFSRSSSRLSFQDDLDDCPFSCPFDVDDVETSDSHLRTSVDRILNQHRLYCLWVKNLKMLLLVFSFICLGQHLLYAKIQVVTLLLPRGPSLRVELEQHLISLCLGRLQMH